MNIHNLKKEIGKIEDELFSKLRIICYKDTKDEKKADQDFKSIETSIKKLRELYSMSNSNMANLNDIFAQLPKNSSGKWL